jgi:hypothetical protein
VLSEQWLNLKPKTGEEKPSFYTCSYHAVSYNSQIIKYKEQFNLVIPFDYPFLSLRFAMLSVQ